MNILRRHAYDIGAGFAALVWAVMPKRRRIAVDNVLKCGVTADPGEARRIARKSFCHLAGHICEALCVPGVVDAGNWREHLDVETEASPEAVKLLLESPDTPIILASAHHGVWEAATNILSFARPMIAIARVMNNRLAARWMKKHHFRGPVTVIDKKNGYTPEIMHQWKNECAAMTILMDQHTSGGLKLEFLGRPAKTFTSVTRLAMRTGYPVVVGSFVRIAPYRYRLVGGAPLRFSRGDDLAKCTQMLNDRLGEAIRRYPEQYLWVHRRWR
ncbi:MAG: lysophospholipid acyltransferase family protein [Kiritimatiellae bacterium]|nr:lysophospholipid acyltransferase family protein [Kiritimatiellia bacterium]